MSSSNEMYSAQRRDVPASVKMRYNADQALPTANGYNVDVITPESDEIVPIYGPDMEIDADGNLVLYTDDGLAAYYGEAVNMFDTTDGVPEYNDDTVVTIVSIADIAKQ